MVWWWFSVVWPECIRSSFGSDVVQMWFGDVVSEVVWWWFSVVWLECIRSSFGSDVVQLWFGHGSAAVCPMLIQLCVA